MLVHVERDGLLLAAKQTALAVPKHSTVEELTGIHIQADAQRNVLTLTATNNEIVICASTYASVEDSGSMVVNAKLLTEILSKLPGNHVDMQLDNNSELTIRCGATLYRLLVLSGEKYPLPEVPYPEDTVSITGLRSLVRQTAFATADDDKAPLMRCIKVILGPDGLKGIGTNGFCIVETQGDKNCKGITELLIRIKG